MKKTYVSVATYKTKPVEPSTGKSRTQPNMALTIPEILQKYANGGRINAVPGVYTGETLFPDPRRMDMVDIDDLKAQTEHEIKRLTKQRDELLQKDSERQTAALQRQQNALAYYDKAILKLSGNGNDVPPTNVEVRENAA